MSQLFFKMILMLAASLSNDRQVTTPAADHHEHHWKGVTLLEFFNLISSNWFKTQFFALNFPSDELKVSNHIFRTSVLQLARLVTGGCTVAGGWKLHKPISSPSINTGAKAGCLAAYGSEGNLLKSRPMSRLFEHIVKQKNWTNLLRGQPEDRLH